MHPFEILPRVDGLLLDRQRGFRNKLGKVKKSFSKNFCQARISKQAFTRVIELNGPLHMAFHMLQSVYIVFKDVVVWGQAILNWKRILYLEMDVCIREI